MGAPIDRARGAISMSMSMSNLTSVPPIPADIAATTAPQLIGTLINFILYGVLSVQTYIYYLNFPDDSIWNKLLVYGAYVFEVVQTAMTGADLYFWFASGFGNLAHLGNVNVSPADTPILCGLIAAVVQCFFAYRIFTLRRSYLWLCVLIVLTSAVQTAGAMGVGYRAFKLQEYARFHEDVLFPQSFDVWLIGDTVCDILIAGTMLWIFHETRRDGTSHGTQILGKLVRLIVETNTLTAGMALVSFVCYAALPNSSIFICTTLVMGKLYSNTLLVTFNNRIALRALSAGTPSASAAGSYESRSAALRGLRSPRTPKDFGGESGTTFRVAPSAMFGQHSAASPESFEIENMKSAKPRDLTTFGSPV